MKIWDYHKWYNSKPNVKPGDTIKFYEDELVILSVINGTKHFNELHTAHGAFFTKDLGIFILGEEDKDSFRFSVMRDDQWSWIIS